MRRAFTLIELLVVIAIIAILAAILFPVFAQARTKARQSVCLSNMKQMGLAVMMYAEDFDETYPPAVIREGANCNGGTGCRGVASWKSVTFPYAKNKGIYECPELRAQFQQFYDPASTNAQYNFLGDEVAAFCDPTSPTYTGQPLCSYSGGNFFVRGYSLNGAVFQASFDIGSGNVVGDDYITGMTGPRTMADLPQPGDTVMIMDTKSWNVDSMPGAVMRCTKAMGISHGPWTAIPDPSSPTGVRYQIGWIVSHTKGSQFAFADGHAKWERLQSAYARNDFKYDCQKNANDERTFPLGQFTTAECGSTYATDGPTCAAVAAQLVPFENL